MEFLGFIAGITFLQAVILIIGLILVIVEMFHPGFGAPGITGLLLLIFGIVLVAHNFLQAFILIIIILAILGIALTLVLHSATKGRLSKTLVLSDSLKRESGFSGTEDLDCYMGMEGRTLSILRPSGTADFNGVKLDVVSQGEYIPKDANVKIIIVEGRRIVVREI